VHTTSVPSFYQFLVYAVILHSCSYVAHITVAEAHCCRVHSVILVMNYNVLYRQPVHCGVHIQYTLWCFCPLSALLTFFHLLGFAKSYQMTFQSQEKSRKVTLVGQSHLKNP
jgi:hypothetical protein